MTAMTMTAPTTMIQNLAFLSMDEVRHNAPAVFGYAAPQLTDRYEMVRTGDVLESLIDRGYRVTSAKQDKATKRDPMTVRHMVTLVHEQALTQAFAEGVPTLLLWNSNNGRTLLRAAAGFYRFICSNGLIVGVTEQEFAFRHSVTPVAQIPQALELIAERQEMALKRMIDWQQIELDSRKVVSFAEKAAQLRFGEKAGGAYNRDEVLAVRRTEDEGSNLWRVMNRVQENLLRGGVTGQSANGRKVTSRAANSLSLDLEFNRGLWQLAEDFAQAA
jgi:Domain of unknown function (DUF932)